jgi:hypothetical protein
MYSFPFKTDKLVSLPDLRDAILGVKQVRSDLVNCSDVHQPVSNVDGLLEDKEVGLFAVVDISVEFNTVDFICYNNYVKFFIIRTYNADPYLEMAMLVRGQYVGTAYRKSGRILFHDSQIPRNKILTLREYVIEFLSARPDMLEQTVDVFGRNTAQMLLAPRSSNHDHYFGKERYIMRRPFPYSTSDASVSPEIRHFMLNLCYCDDIGRKLNFIDHFRCISDGLHFVYVTRDNVKKIEQWCVLQWDFEFYSLVALKYVSAEAAQESYYDRYFRGWFDSLRYAQHRRLLE